MTQDVIKYAQELLQTSGSSLQEVERSLWSVDICKLMPCVLQGKRNSNLTRYDE